MRRVSDEQVALYLEEHEPTLEATIITAMEAERDGRGAGHVAGARPQLIEARRSNAYSRSRRGGASNASRSGATATAAGGRRYRRARDLRARAGLSASCALGAARDLARCRSGGAVSHRRDARQRNGARRAPIRPFPRRFTASTRATRPSSCASRPTRPTSACRWCAPRTARYDGMLFDLAEGLEYYVEAAGVRSRNFTPESRRAALRQATRSRVSLPDLHRARAADGRRRRRCRHAARGPTSVCRSSRRWRRRAGASSCTTARSSPLTANADGTLARQLHRLGQRLVSRRARWARGRKGRGVAANTRSTSWPIRRRRSRCRSRAATPMPRRCRNSSSRRAPTTTSPSGTCSSCTRSTAGPRRRSGSSTAASRRPKSRPATRSISRSLACSPATPCRITRSATDNDVTGGPEARDERHLLPAHPAVRQGLQAGDLDGRRWRWRRRRRRRSRRAVAAAASDHRRHLQGAARSPDDGRRQGQGSAGRARAVAEPAARAGRRAWSSA